MKDMKDDNKKTIDYFLKKLKFKFSMGYCAGDPITEFFHHMVLTTKQHYLKFHTEEEFFTMAKELIPLIPQAYFDGQVIPTISGSIIERTLCCCPVLTKDSTKWENISEWHEIIDMVMERTHKPEAVNAVDSHYPLKEALDKGAKLEVIKKLIELSSVKFTYNRYHKIYDGKGALKYPYTMAKYPDEKDFSNYSPKETKEIKELIIKKFEDLREKTKNPITFRARLAASTVSKRFSNIFKTTDINNAKNSHELTKGQPNQKSYSQTNNQLNTQKQQTTYCQ